MAALFLRRPGRVAKRTGVSRDEPLRAGRSALVGGVPAGQWRWRCRAFPGKREDEPGRTLRSRGDFEPLLT